MSNFSLSEAEGNTSGPLNRVGTADLSFLGTLLVIHQKYLEPSFWEGRDIFVLLAYSSLAASRTLLQLLIPCLKLPLDSEDLFCW